MPHQAFHGQSQEGTYAVKGLDGNFQESLFSYAPCLLQDYCILIEVLAELLETGEVVIPGKRSTTRNPARSGIKEFWMPAFAEMTG